MPLFSGFKNNINCRGFGATGEGQTVIAVDTNVLVRYIVRDDELQARAADALLDTALLNEDAVFVSSPVLCELVWVLQRGYGFGVRHIANVIGALLGESGFQVEHPVELARALKRYHSSKVGITDLLIGEIARSEGCRTVFTFDRMLAKLPGFEATPVVTR